MRWLVLATESTHISLVLIPCHINIYRNHRADGLVAVKAFLEETEPSTDPSIRLRNVLQNKTVKAVFKLTATLKGC